MSFTFGPYRLIPSQRLLLRAEKPIPVSSRALDLLLALVEHAGSLVTKEQLLASAWPTTNVHEANLRVHIGVLRKLLGDGPGGSRYIVSDAGRGYRFVAPVEVVSDAADPPRERSGAVRERRNGGETRNDGTAVIGRSDVIDALIEQLHRRRLITLLGPGGIGKTTVALAVAERLRPTLDVVFVDLAPITDASLVYGTIASALGFVDHSENHIKALLPFLRAERRLIVLDNCEHVIDALAPLVDAMIGVGPNVQLLATSREALRVRSERVFKLEPLDLPAPDAKLSAAAALAFPAIQLFVERAAACFADFEFHDGVAATVHHICRKLDGLPLAIELAAGRIESFGLSGLAGLIDKRLPLPVAGRRTAAPRHQTLVATLDWSYETLPQPERAALRRLAIFSGQFTLPSAVAIAADSELEDAADVVERVANLVDKSLVSVDLSNPESRYRLLDTTRNYALKKLSEASELGRTATRHARNCMTLLEQAEPDRIKDDAAWLAAHRHEIDDVRGALDWAFAHGEARLGRALTLAAVPLWTHLSLNEERHSRIEAALSTLQAGNAAEERTRMQLLVALAGASLLSMGAVVETRKSFYEALAIATTLGDVDYQLRALWGLWNSDVIREDCQGAVTRAETFLAVAAASPIPADALIGERLIAVMKHLMGHGQEARRLIERLLTRYQPHPSHLVRFQHDQQTVARAYLAIIVWLQGSHERAVQIAEENIEESKHSSSICHALILSACPIALYNGDLSAADHWLTMLRDLSRHHRSEYWEKLVCCYEGVLLIKRGQLNAGIEKLTGVLDNLRISLLHVLCLPLLCELAKGLLEARRHAEALTAIEKAVRISEASEEVWCLPELLRVRGEIACALGRTREAENWFDQSLAWSRRQNALSWELRAATSLACLWQDLGRVDEAADLLGGVYERFTERRETFDLKTARERLELLKRVSRSGRCQNKRSG